MMNIESATNFPPILTQPKTSTAPTAKSSPTAALLVKIPQDVNAAVELSEQIANAFASSPGLKIVSGSLTA